MKLKYMIKKNKPLFCLCFLILMSASASSQTLPIKLNPQAINQVKLTSQPSNGSFTFFTEGTDPFIASYDISQKYDPDSVYTLTFDYLAPGGLKAMQVYFGPPFSEANSIKLDDLPADSVYKNIVVNIRNYTDHWDQAFTKFRFDLGNQPGQQVSIKNIVLKKNIDYTALNKNKAVINYANSSFQNKISSVIVHKDSIIIKGNIDRSGQNLFLSELYIFNDLQDQYTSFNNLISINNKQSGFEISVPRFININDTVYDRIYSRWVITSKSSTEYKLTSYAHYADDIYGAMKQYLPEEKPESKKGLAGFAAASNTVNDVADLGIKNVTVNVSLTGLSSLSPTQYSFQFNGGKYYFNPSLVNSLDKTFKACSDQNIITSAIILISRNVTDSMKSIFVFPGSDKGIYSMGNVTSLKGINYYAAAIGFLAERYSRADKEFGRINNWIIHNEVDDGVIWTNAGNAQMQYYVDLYDRSLRTVYYTVRQYNPAAKVFLSFTQSWAYNSTETHFSPKDMLTIFNDLSIKQGDYEWGIAYHPYPQSLNNPQTWNDKDASNDINTSRYITPKNIELIDAWMRTKTHLYNGMKIRSLLFSEQGINSKSYNADDLQVQAAGIAYMWKKFNRLPSLEAFDYHREVDNMNENGFLLGLWTAKQGTAGTPGDKKPSWYVLKYAGTSAEDSAFSFALPVIGINNWSQAYNPLQGEVMPVTVNFVVTKKLNASAPLLLFFNGEMHELINNKAVFYNVAVLPQNRKYLLYQNDKIIVEGSVSVTKDTTINLDEALH